MSCKLRESGIRRKSGCWTRSSHLFLLILRLYFGWGFMSAGLGKLLNVETHDGLLPGLGHPLADAQRLPGGDNRDRLRFLLLVGSASRIITIPLIVTMFVAYLTAHTEQFVCPVGQHAPVFQGAAVSLPVHVLCRAVLRAGRLSVDGLIHGSWRDENTIPGGRRERGERLPHVVQAWPVSISQDTAQPFLHEENHERRRLSIGATCTAWHLPPWAD